MEFSFAAADIKNEFCRRINCLLQPLDKHGAIFLGGDDGDGKIVGASEMRPVHIIVLGLDPDADLLAGLGLDLRIVPESIELQLLPFPFRAEGLSAVIFNIIFI